MGWGGDHEEGESRKVEWEVDGTGEVGGVCIEWMGSSAKEWLSRRRERRQGCRDKWPEG